MLFLYVLFLGGVNCIQFQVGCVKHHIELYPASNWLYPRFNLVGDSKSVGVDGKSKGGAASSWHKTPVAHV